MLAKAAQQSTQLDWVHIHSCGNGHLGFRPDCGSLCKSGKVSKTLLPHHSAPRLGSVCPNTGLNPWAAATRHPWRGAANPASCRVTHEFKPAFGQRGLTGRLRSRSQADQEQDQARLASHRGYCGVCNLQVVHLLHYRFRRQAIMPVSSGFFVGASLLAKNLQAPRSFSKHALLLTFFASKLAPTEIGAAHTFGSRGIG